MRVGKLRMVSMWLAAGAAGLVASAAVAQDAEPATSDAPASTDQPVTVTAQTKPIRRTVEGRVYDERNNPQAQSGSAADVLKTVPSVTVTPDGDVRLRGDGNVQVYINGKPSAMMQGEGRGLTLQAMPGSAIASVEVITNPSAKYGANGSGIINIVLKKGVKAGATGNLAVNAGADRRGNASLTGNYGHDRFNVHGTLSVRDDLGPRRQSTQTQWRDLMTGTTTRSDQSVDVSPRRLSSLAVAGIDYELSAHDTLSLEATAKENHAANQIDELHRDYDADGDLSDAYDRRSTGPRRQTDTALTASFNHRADDGGELRLQLNHSRSVGFRDKSYINIYSFPDTADQGVRVIGRTVHGLDEASGDAVVAAGETGQLSFGFDLQAISDDLGNDTATIDPATGSQTIDANLTNRFAVHQQIAAAYTTWQVKTGALTILAGLRGEWTKVHNDNAGSAVTRHAYGSLIPTLHLTYALDTARELSASFSQSYQRPDPRDLNPFTTYVDAQNLTSGSPDLKPQRVTSAELGYAYDHDDTDRGVTLYYKRSRRTVTDYSYLIGDNLLMTTKRNSGDGLSAGVELTATGKWSPKLSYNTSLNLFHVELQADDLTGRVKRAGNAWTAQLGLDYEAANDDQFGLDSQFSGRSVTAQGSTSGTTALNLSYRHRLNNRLWLNVSARDVTNGYKVESLRNTASVTQVDRMFQPGQVIMIGLSYRLGRWKGA